jgi:hypothetical protein
MKESSSCRPIRPPRTFRQTLLLETRGEQGETIWYLDGDGVGASLGIRQALSSSDPPYGRYAVGSTTSVRGVPKEMVDERFRWVAAQGAIENEPQEWPYVAGYYATFLRDPDSLELDVVFVP